MPARIELAGKRFGKWRVLSEAPRKPGSRLRRYNVVCDCGTHKAIAANELTRNKQPSTNCGCLRADGVREVCTTHGLRQHVGYMRYHAMMARCYDKYNKEYDNYGGRGITVYRPWRHPTKGLARFCEYIDSLPGYAPRMEIDRIDNDKGYKPGNIRWATRKRNMRNLRKTVIVVWRGRRVALADICERRGVTGRDYYTVRGRIRKGWPVKAAIETPIVRKRLLNV